MTCFERQPLWALNNVDDIICIGLLLLYYYYYYYYILFCRTIILINISAIIQGGARNVIPLIVHITHFYYYKSFLHLVQN